MKFPSINNITLCRTVNLERVWEMSMKRGISGSPCSWKPISDKGRMPLHKLSIEGVNDIIAVASGKGGVGKSTTAVNLAVALAVTCRLKVGLLDADVYGPSIPTMMKLQGRPQVTEDMKMVPMENHGVKCISMGFLTEKDAPIVWRGPMVMSALEKLTRGVAWGNIDILVADMPPGTGDAQLSMSQRLQLSGAVIVSTPQDIALLDARRGANMFRKVEVPILGLIENMSCFKCPHCGQDSYIFGNKGAQLTAQEMEMEFLGEVPLNTEIRETSDAGNPIVVAYPDCEASKAYKRIAGRIVEKLYELKTSKVSTPQIII
ncbi:iron-sulfur protein required for NADH dehydrogenase, mitochondrial isoform X1 [Cryptomeria japonica]|uniref:iron-sulfur protein required for NADH dehydrogenase, mitochondrial isoform X1 n=1 Tax=Cryptomeria japonica TaxID=3369 RepID=UPI0025AD3850|nr:iron-sulfur protein required for NADH dehydrogenase, mitochondrial isoform X1 [Cryptomeria japonica]